MEKAFNAEKMELVFEFNPMGKVFTGIGDAPNPAVFTILKHRHTWDNGSITKKPTQLEEGQKTFTCMTCSYTKAEIIPLIAAIKKRKKG